MKSDAQRSLSDQHATRWPHVSGGLFSAILGALGDISVDEAIAALDRINNEDRLAQCERERAEKGDT